MPRYIYQKRAFLAPRSTSATSHVLAQVQNTFEGQDAWGENMLVIADCHRSIHFEFHLGTRTARRISLAKINLLIRVLSEFRDALSKEITLIEKGK